MPNLALLGGAPVRAQRGEYLRWPTVGDDERDAMRRACARGFFGVGGPESERFARDFAAYCGAAYALPVLSGTTSLELALRALNIGYGDEVIVAPYTFSASITAIAMTGATPVFADIDFETLTLSPSACERAITPRTRAIMAVHLGGRPCDMDALDEIARRHGLPIVEDASHAHGSEWRGKRAGSLGAVAGFSLQVSKNISCGEGGVATTNDRALYERMRALATGYAGGAVPGVEARLGELACALLNARLLRLDADIRRRMRSAAMLTEAFESRPFLSPLRRDARVTRDSLHLYGFRYLPDVLGVPRNLFVRALQAENVCNVDEGYCEPIYDSALFADPMYVQSTGDRFVDPTPRLPGNERAARVEGAWMQHVSLLGEDEDIRAIVRAIDKIADNARELRDHAEGGDGA